MAPLAAATRRGRPPPPPPGGGGGGGGGSAGADVAAGWVSTGGGSLALGGGGGGGAAAPRGRGAVPLAVGEDTPLVGSGGGSSSGRGGGAGGHPDKDGEEAYYEDEDEAYEYEEDVLGEWDDLHVHPVIEEEVSGMKAQRAAYIIGTGSCVVILVVILVILSGVSSLLSQRHDPVFTIESDFPDGGIIPLRYGCRSPTHPPQSLPLRWSHVPRGTQSLVVLMHDPDSIRVNGTDPIHWLLLNVSVAGTPPVSLPSLSGSAAAPGAGGGAAPAATDDDAAVVSSGFLPPGASDGALPPGTETRPNAAGLTGYWPPCVHNGSHLFSIYVYAVDAAPVLANYADARNVMNRFGGVPLAKLFGWYGAPNGVGGGGAAAVVAPASAAAGGAAGRRAAVAAARAPARRRVAAAAAAAADAGGVPPAAMAGDGGIVWMPGGTCSSFGGRSCRRVPAALA